MSKTGISWQGEKTMPIEGVRTGLISVRCDQPFGNIAGSTLGG
jgi:hypothetical protein